MPGLTIATGVPAPARPGLDSSSGSSQPSQAGTSADPRSSSPEPPPVSPITPMLGPTQLPGDPSTTGPLTPAVVPSSHNAQRPKPQGVPAAPGPSAAAAAAVPASAGAAAAAPDFAQGRQPFIHSQPDQVGAVPPPAEPIAFDDNPDVLALKSAISILQLQRAKAANDMRTLSRAKAEALAEPGAFLADLQTGYVHQEGDLLFPRPVHAPMQDEGDESSSDDSDDSEDGDESPPTSTADAARAATATATATGDAGTSDPLGSGSSVSSQPASQKPRKAKKQGRTAKKPWHNLPKPQNVVRCPPLNWAQYGVVGDSLDKLHAEQQAAPTQGVPAVLGPGGTFDFRAGDQPTGEQRRLVGVAAPYAPGKDRLDKKTKAGKK